MNKLIFGGAWLLFTLYAFLFAPANDSATFELIINLSTGNIKNINPFVIALFNLMGILPAVYACLLLVDGRGQKLPAWVFVLGSFGFGAFALFPYFALRKSSSSWVGKTDWLLEILESPLTAITLLIATLSLIFFGLSNGNWLNFTQLWQSHRFINVMSIDFCCLCLCLPVTIKDDLVKRGVKNPAIIAIISFIPLLGTLIYLCLRPRLVAAEN